ncbi:MFS transporter [Noviherbaspirillum sp. CPCC 100848]|uniref:MFS transporter n=1 Tax=Noviherbaspirillum album TaxID=3080276 RepID=A0ABU6JBE6_9BURK|nr:MFS transporter [Noviherbaspirillum sp. CPCC 100848]MEC4720753.1 MFS transporter [Noviherbaspirillum sp. CPCC 100848]
MKHPISIPADRAQAGAKSRIGFRVFAILCVFVVALVSISVTLVAFRVEHVVLKLAQERSFQQGRQIQEQVDEAVRLGIALEEMSHLSRTLQEKADEDVSLAAIAVLGESTDVIDGVRADLIKQAVNPVWNDQLLGRHGVPADRSAHVVGPFLVSGLPIIDALGKRAAVLWLLHSRADIRQQTAALVWKLAPVAIMTSLLLIAVSGFYCGSLLQISRRRLQYAEAAASNALMKTGVAPQVDVDVRAFSLSEEGKRVARMLWHGGLLVALVFCAGLTLMLWQAREHAKDVIQEQLQENAASVGNHLAVQINRSLSLGVPFERLLGVDDIFAIELQQSKEIRQIQLQDASGRIVGFKQRHGAESGVKPAEGSPDQSSPERSGMFSFPLKDASSGKILVTYPENYVDRYLGSMIVDQIIAILIAFVLVSEVARIFWVHSAFKPLTEFELWMRSRTGIARTSLRNARERLARWMDELRLEMKVGTPDKAGDAVSDITKVRLLVFLVAMSEEVLRPIIATYAADAKPFTSSLSVTMLAGLPVAAFMTTLALAQPLGVMLVRWIDLRRAMVIAGVIGAVLMTANLSSNSGLVLLVLRGATGMVYGLMLILAQTAIVHITDSKGRARGLAEISAAIVAAGIIGPALGGVIAERFGSLPLFPTAGAFYLLAGLVALFLPLLQRTEEEKSSPSPSSAKGFVAVFRQPQVLSVIFCVAIPARLAAAAILNILIPLYLVQTGDSATTIGRVLLLYFLAFFLSAPLAARWSDRTGRRKPYVLSGCVLSVFACGIMAFASGAVAIGICSFLLGVAQALLSAPQLAIVTEIFERRGKDPAGGKALAGQGLAAFRLLERAGSIAAPFVAAIAAGMLGLAGAVVFIGVILAMGTAGFVFGLRNYNENENEMRDSV